jgi:hypothetical protein
MKPGLQDATLDLRNPDASPTRADAQKSKVVTDPLQTA